MSFNTAVIWVFPPNWDGNPPPLGDNGFREVTVKLTGESGAADEEVDGVGNTPVRKVDISELFGANGLRAIRTSIMKIKYDIQGLNYVKLEWDRPGNDSNRLIAYLPGELNGFKNYKREGGKPDPSDGTDGTGDLMLSTDGAADGSSYDIDITFKLKTTAPVKASTSPG